MPRGRKGKDIAGSEIIEETVPMDDVVDVAVEDNSNGHAPPTNIPGQTDVFVATGGGSPNLAMEMITGSLEPDKYLLRGRLSLKEIQDIQEIIATENEVNYGATDLMYLIAYRFNASAGANGQARAEAVKIGTAVSRMQMFRRGMSGMFNRFRGGDGGGY